MPPVLVGIFVQHTSDQAFTYSDKPLAIAPVQHDTSVPFSNLPELFNLHLHLNLEEYLESEQQASP